MIYKENLLTDGVAFKVKMFGETSADLFLFDGSQDWDEFVQECVARITSIAFGFDCAELWDSGKKIEVRDSLTERVILGKVKAKSKRGLLTVIVKF